MVVRDCPDVPPSLGPVLLEKPETGKSKNAVEQIVVREAEADNIVI